MMNGLIELAEDVLIRALWYLNEVDLAALNGFMTRPAPVLTFHPSQQNIEFRPGDQRSSQAQMRDNNFDKLINGLAAMMEGKKPTPFEEDALAELLPLFKLPSDIRGFAKSVCGVVRHYDQREETIKQFPELYDRVALPVFKQRLARHGIDGLSIQKTLQSDATLNPLFGIWLLSGVVPPTVRRDGSTSFSLIAVDFVNAIFGKDAHRFAPGKLEGGAFSDGPLRMLVDSEKLTKMGMAIDVYMGDHLTMKYPTAGYLASLNALPTGLNSNFDRARDQALIEMRRSRDRLEFCTAIYSVSKTSMPHSIFRKELDGRATEWTPFRPFPADFLVRLKQNSVFTRSKGAEESAFKTSPSWDHIPEFLRTKFELLDLRDAKTVAASINHLPRQVDVQRDALVSLRSRAEQGHHITPEDVILTLSHPEAVRHASGPVRLLHYILARLVDPLGDVDAFYGQPPFQADTLMRKTAMALEAKIREAMKVRELARFAVSDQQVATLYGIPSTIFSDFFDHIDQAYGAKDTDRSKSLDILAQKFGISFSFDECLAIRAEMRDHARARRLADEQARQHNRRTRLAFQKESKETVSAPLPNSPAAITHPWRDIPDAVVELCQRKELKRFADVVASLETILAEKIEVSTGNAEPRDVERQAKIALSRFGMGYLPTDGRPISVMHAYMKQLLGLTGRDVQQFQVKLGGSQDVMARLEKFEVQANIVEAILDSPALPHIISWGQLSNEYRGADVVQLTDNLSNAYRIKKPKELVIEIGDVLSLIMVPLNARRPEMYQLEPQAVVSLDAWLKSYRGKARQKSVFASDVCADALKFG